MGNFFRVILVVAQLFSLSSFARVATLAERLEAESAQPESGFTGPFKQKLSQRHVVFVDGIMNEAAQLVGNYYSDNISEVEHLGLSYTHLRYSSGVSIPRNAETLYNDLQNIYDEVQKPLILIGHSKGGAEALYTVLKHPELLLANHVERVVLISPAIGGSPLADNVADGFWGGWIKHFLSEGLVSLTPAVAHQNFREVYDSFQNWASVKADFNRLSNRVFYIRSYSPPEAELSWGVRSILFFCKQGLDPSVLNDGLLNASDQILDVTPSFGVDLGMLKADHIELIVSGRVSHSDPERRKAFTRAFLQGIYQTEWQAE